MRIGILSDTHDQLPLTRRAVQLLQREGAEALIHCGDLTGPDIVRACAVLPCVFAFGNHDADNAPALERAIAEVSGTCLRWGGVLSLGGKRLAVVHGHTGMRALAAGKPDYLLHGLGLLVTRRVDGPDAWLWDAEGRRGVFTFGYDDYPNETTLWAANPESDAAVERLYRLLIAEERNHVRE